PRKVNDPYEFVKTLQPSVYILVGVFLVLYSLICAAITCFSSQNISIKQVHFCHVAVDETFGQLGLFLNQAHQNSSYAGGSWYRVLLTGFLVYRFYLCSAVSSELTSVMLVKKAEFSVNSRLDV